MTRAILLETTDAVARITGYITLALALLWFATPAQAETYAHLGAWSHHVGTNQDYNETHNLAALEHNQIIAGYFKNSYGDDSFMAAYRFKEPVTPHIELSLLAGASYGYRGDCMTQDGSEPKSVCPLVAPVVTYTEYRVEPSIMLMGSAVVLSVRWGL